VAKYSGGWPAPGPMDGGISGPYRKGEYKRAAVKVIKVGGKTVKAVYKGGRWIVTGKIK
jgi:hypothetical protein